MFFLWLHLNILNKAKQVITSRGIFFDTATLLVILSVRHILSHYRSCSQTGRNLSSVAVASVSEELKGTEAVTPTFTFFNLLSFLSLFSQIKSSLLDVTRITTSV